MTAERATNVIASLLTIGLFVWEYALPASTPRGGGPILPLGIETRILLFSLTQIAALLLCHSVGRWLLITDYALQTSAAFYLVALAIALFFTWVSILNLKLFFPEVSHLSRPEMWAVLCMYGALAGPLSFLIAVAQD